MVRAGSTAALRAILGGVDVEFAAVELIIIKLLNRFLGLRLTRKLDEGKTPRPACHAIDGKIHVHDLPRGGKQTG